jgi:hypothetical protein
MSEARELPAVVVSESEEEELLSEDEVVPEQVERQMPLVPLDRRGVSKIGTGDEFRLRNNYDIRPSVLLHFQNPVTREIRGGDLVIYEKMLLAGLRFPLPDIARELVLFLGVSLSQLTPNAWRYLLASFILWRTVLGARMTIPEFFNIYRAAYKRERVVEFTVRNNPIFIYLSQSYSNNRGWRSDFFRVSGDWESVAPLPSDQRVSRVWNPIQVDLREAPALNATGKRRVAAMLLFSQTPGNDMKIDYDNIVTDENMRKVFGYQIPTEKVWYDRKGKQKPKRSEGGAAGTPQPKASKVAPGTKRVIKPKKTGKVTHPPRTVSKATQVPRTAIVPRDSLTPNFSVPGTDLGSDLTKAPETTIPATSSPAVINPVEVRNPEEASGRETVVVQTNDFSIGVVHAPDVVEIGDDPELEQEASEVRSASKRKGKEVASESSKRTRFASDPLEYALMRATEAELLFGRPRFVLPTLPATREEPIEESDTSDRSPAERIEARLESDAGLASEDHLPAEHETFLQPQNGPKSGDHVVVDSEGHLETGEIDSSVPAGECLDRVEVAESSGPETCEDQPETRNPSPGFMEAETSRQGALLGSLREGLLACPLETLMGLIPEGSFSMFGTVFPGGLAEAMLHNQLQVSPVISKISSHTLRVFSNSHFFFFFFLWSYEVGCLVARPPGYY